ncbi:MAG: hypothetical protein QGG42_00570, partial [Phycisphaerae bacterium]|nr:hypothetical protein [Phycisphaerae bacterium]
MTAKKPKGNKPAKKHRTRVSQSDVPVYSLEHALRIPMAIHENYAGKPTTPLRVASAMKMQPSSGPFRGMCGSAIAYGLTQGGGKASEIKLTPLGQRVVRPLKEGDDLAAKREALLNPRVMKEFLTKYDGCPIPRDSIAENVLNDFGVPSDRTSSVLASILEGAEALSLITDIKGKRYVELQGATPTAAQPDTPDKSEGGGAEGADEVAVSAPTPPATRQVTNTAKLKRVFITHGKNKEFVDPIKRLLTFGEMEPVVSVEKQSVS